MKHGGCVAVSTGGIFSRMTCVKKIPPEDERRQKEGGNCERSEQGGVNFCCSESQSSVQEVGVSESAHCYAHRKGFPRPFGVLREVG